MKRINFILFLAFVITLCQLFSCKKSSFLDAKPNQSLVLLKSVSDLQALLDNDNIINGTNGTGTPTLGEIATDDYYVQDDQWVNVDNSVYLNSYLWAKQIYAGEEIPDWDLQYQSIFYANSALVGLQTMAITSQNAVAYNNVKGSALFYRGHMFWQLAQVFAPVYKTATANTDLGIPLRLSSDINEKIERSSVQKTYDQIITDLKQSINLLPVTPEYKYRPSRPAAYALLARTYQTMENYPQALLYADSCLQLDGKLLDFNTIDLSNDYPFLNDQYADEVIFNCFGIVEANSYAPIGTYVALMDTTLQKSYATNDLRPNVFNASFGLRGLYGNENDAPFSGIATDEVYLIRAECLARAGNFVDAMNALNILLKSRWKSGTYSNYTATSATDALKQILEERRKELPKRCLRWTDLRRLNLDPNYAVTLTRSYMSKTYTLPPNDARYVYPIPDNVISLNPGMPQNNR